MLFRSTESALIPFTVALAWQCAPMRMMAVPTAIVALTSPAIAGWLFGWSAQTTISTIIPCALILGLGYRRATRQPHPRFLRHAFIVAAVGGAWFVAALTTDAILGLIHVQLFKLYGTSNFFADLRFYIGWILGLALVPSAELPKSDEAARR